MFHLKRRGSLKDRWQETLSQSRAQDALKVEAVKASTYSERDLADNIGTVEALRKRFSQLYLQEHDLERCHRLLSREVGFDFLMCVSDLGATRCIEAGTGYYIDGNDCAKLSILQSVLQANPNSDIYFQIGVYGDEGSEVPPIEIYACVAQRSNSLVIIPFLVDLPPELVDEPSCYGYYKFAMYLPSHWMGQTPSSDYAPELVMELEIDLIPRGGWDAFHLRKKPPPLPPPPPRSDSFPQPQPPVFTIEDIGYMLDQLNLSSSGPSSCFILRSSPSTRHLRVVDGIAPCLLYHEKHSHRMVPSSVLHPDTELFSRQCRGCFWIESTHCSPVGTTLRAHGKTLEFVCPECAFFLCSECCRKGNGVIGSVQSRQLSLNSEVLFQPGTSALMQETGGMLTQVGRFLLDNAIPIRIEGHINTVQSSGKVLPASSSQIKVLEESCDGQRLSERRAIVVREFLEAMGVDPGLMHAVGWGGSRPISTEKDLVNYNRYCCECA